MKSTLAILVLSLVCSAPAAAIIPPAGLQVGGAEWAGQNAYIAVEGSLISLAFRAEPGDAMGLFAIPVTEAAMADYPPIITLALNMNSTTGVLAGVFQVPNGLAGQSFEVVAASLNVDGQLTLERVTMRIRGSDQVRDDAAEQRHADGL
jgi:hypothetical protein